MPHILFLCSNLVELRTKYKEPFLKKHGLKLGFMSPFLKASAYALMDQPAVNGVIDDNEIVYRDYVDISVAVATPKVRKGNVGFSWGRKIMFYTMDVVSRLGNWHPCRSELISEVQNRMR